MKNIVVILTRNAPQGFAAMLRLIPDGTLEENEEAMLEAIQEVHTGEIPQPPATLPLTMWKWKRQCHRNAGWKVSIF